MKLNYKIGYAQSFMSSVIVFFIGLFLSFVMTLLVSKVIGWSFFGLVILYLLYWNFKKDGKLSILSQENQKQLQVSGKVELNEGIKAIHKGWSYAYHSPIKGLKGQVSHFVIPINYNKKSEKTTQNTFQKIMILELKNGQNIALIQELLPWQETGDLEYIGHLVDKMTFDSELYIRGGFKS